MTNQNFPRCILRLSSLFAGHLCLSPLCETVEVSANSGLDGVVRQTPLVRWLSQQLLFLCHTLQLPEVFTLEVL